MGRIHFFIVNALCSLTVNKGKRFPSSGQPVSRILSRVRIYLGKLSPACSCGLPRDQASRAGSFSCLSLHRMGVTLPALLPTTRWSLTPPFQPYYPKEAVCFCGPIRKLAPSQVLPGIQLCGVRTFLTANERAHLADLS